jgi:hypothetical protein
MDQVIGFLRLQIKALLDWAVIIANGCGVPRQPRG